MRLLRGTGLRLAGQGVGGLASIAVLPFLIRHLGIAEFGRYVAVLSVVAIAALASDIGLTGIALRDSAVSEGERRHELVSGLFGVRLAVAALGVVAAIGFAAVAGYGSAVVAGAAIASLGLFPQIYADMVVVTLVVDGRFGAAAAIETARSVGSSVLIIVLVIAGAGITWFLAAWAGAALIAAATAARYGRESVPLKRPPRGAMRRALAGASGYTLATALHVVYFRAVMLVVAGRGAAAEAGAYGAAFRITEFVGAAAGQASGGATPTLARAAEPGTRLILNPAPATNGDAPGGDPGFRSAATRVIGAAAGFGVVVGGVLALAAPLIMRILGGDALAGSADVLRIQAIAAALMFPAFAAGAALFVTHRYRAMVMANATALIVAVGAALALVPSHGANGGSAAAAAGEAVLLTIELALLTRRPS